MVLNASALALPQPYCYHGTLPLIGTNTRKEAVMKALTMGIEDFPDNLAFTDFFLRHYQDFKSALGLVGNSASSNIYNIGVGKKGTAKASNNSGKGKYISSSSDTTTTTSSFTVVHWRRGDQLTTRCKGQKDRSVNCADSLALIDLVRQNSNDSLIYIATNEKNSAEIENLRNASFVVFQDTGLVNKVTPMEAFILEVTLMIEASTFLGWGISEVNDVVEYERMKKNRTFCTTDEWSFSYVSWCEGQKLKKIEAILAKENTLLEE